MFADAALCATALNCSCYWLIAGTDTTTSSMDCLITSIVLAAPRGACLGAMVITFLALLPWFHTLQQLVVVYFAGFDGQICLQFCRYSCWAR